MKIACLCVLVYTNILSYAEWLGDEIDLQRVLKSRYNKNVVPRPACGHPVVVNVTMYLLNIIKLNEPEELLQSNSWFSIMWVDGKLIWEPEEFSNITSTILKQQDVWTPDLTVLNSTGRLRQIGYDDLNVIVDPSGLVHWEPGLASETICKMDVRYFPFDSQRCSIGLGTWAHSPLIVKFGLTEVTVNKRDFERNGQWELVSSRGEVIPHGTYWTLRFELELSRRPGFIVTTLIIPVVVISTLNTFVFMIPRQSGERMTYSVTTFLSYIVLISLTTGSLPKTSLETPIFVTYLCSMFGLGFLSVLCSAISVNLREYDNKNDNNYKKGTPLAVIKSRSSKPNDNGRNRNEIKMHTDVKTVISQYHKGINGINVPNDQLQDTPEVTTHVTTGTSCNRNAVVAAIIKYFDFYMFFFTFVSTLVMNVVSFHQLKNKY